jgi:diguanylate cyclase (GGDEF)-like protein
MSNYEDESMTQKPTDLNVITNNIVESTKPFYDTSVALQTASGFTKLISFFSSFSNEISSMIPHSAFVYTHAEFGLEVKSGVLAPHSSNYSLQVYDHQLGELTLMRGHKFDDAEINLLETLFCCLIYPLKNTPLYQQTLEMAYIDPLTHINNRASFEETVKREMSQAKRDAQNLSLIFLDINCFQAINDRYGHDFGVIMLTAVAKWLKDGVRGSDNVFRFGEEKFVILLRETDSSDVELMAKRISDLFELNTLTYNSETIKVTACLGVSSFSEDDSIDTFVKRAVYAINEDKKMLINRLV